MITLRPSAERGTSRTGWLESRHSFSFNQYFDAAHVRFGPLLVLNDDVIAPGTGFGTHPHSNMEIVTYVLQGAVAHRDSTGTDAVIRAGEVQRMTAGTGVQHSEYNASESEELRLLQIWFLPDKHGYAPSYEQKAYDAALRLNTLLPVATGASESLSALRINQDLTMFISTLQRGRSLSHELAAERGAYVYLISGMVQVNGHDLAEGDAALLSGEARLALEATSDAEFVVFDLPLRFKTDYHMQ